MSRFNMRINATRMTTPIEVKFDQKLKVRTGMVAVSDGKSRPVPVRLHLSMEVLRLQKEELVPPEPKPINAKVLKQFFIYPDRVNLILAGSKKISITFFFVNCFFCS